MKKISCLSLTLLLLVTAACQTNNHLIPLNNSAINPSPYVGIYKGTLPCADCSGIESRLTLNEDNTFVYENTYIDTIDRRFSYTGRYTVKDNIVTIQQNDIPLHFLRKEQYLVLLDSNLHPPQGVLAPYYVLKKQREFTYPGKYETFSEKEDTYKQTITISSQGSSYQIDFTASQTENLEKCHFSTTAQLKEGRLWANISNDTHEKILMSIAPTHDNLGVEVFDTANHEHPIPFCNGRGSFRQKIERVLIQSPFYKTAKGIHRNSTYQDINNAYTITEIMPDKEHIILVVDEINAHFSIPKTSLYGTNFIVFSRRNATTLFVR